MNYPDNYVSSALDDEALAAAKAVKAEFQDKIRVATVNFRDAIHKATGIEVDTDCLFDAVWELDEIDCELDRLNTNIENVEIGE